MHVGYKESLTHPNTLWKLCTQKTTDIYAPNFNEIRKNLGWELELELGSLFGYLYFLKLSFQEFYLNIRKLIGYWEYV